LTYLDAYALIALMRGESAADEVEVLLRGGDCRVSVVNLAEVIDVSTRVHDLALRDVRDVVQPLFIEYVLVESPRAAHAWKVGELRRQHYHRRERPLSLADCFLIAHAQIDEEAVATSDSAVAAVARGEGIGVVALPDRGGSRP
jgi:predicted nucleic acid-binding protein